MASHTPGPWFMNEYTGSVQINTEQGTVVQPGAISWKPDARLIAAAPNLLAVAMMAVNGARSASLIHEARAAIAKATGSAS